MSEDNLEEGQPKKETAKRFVLRMTAPFRMTTEGLGEIVARALTVSATSVFAKRMPSLDGVPDADLVRAYMGCVSGLPVNDDEALPDPLSEEQVLQLKDEDVQSFARQYLEHIVKPAEVHGDAVAQMAEFIRDERQKNLEAMKKMAETVRSALNIGTTADYMKHWQALTQNVAGPLDHFRDEAKRMLGPLALANSALLGNALRDKEQDRKRMLKAIRGFDDDLLGINGGVLRPKPLPEISIPKLPPEHKTPVGRTAIAVEKLGEVGHRMEEAMGLVLEQAGNVSRMVGEVLTQIEQEAAKSQRAARHAFWVGAISLLLAALALGLSAYLSLVGYRADREDARSNDRASTLLAERVGEQTTIVANRIDQQTAVMREVLEKGERRDAQATLNSAPATSSSKPKAPQKAK